MFKESDWDNDNVTSYKFQSFSKVKQDTTPQAVNKNQKSKEKKEKPKNQDKTKKTEESNSKGSKESTLNSKKQDSSIEIKKKSKKKNKERKLKEKLKDVFGEKKLSDDNTVTGGKLLSKLRENLKGSRFRFLNEQLYTTSGSGGLDLFKANLEDFEAYHIGYRHQVEQWPMNPLRKVISEVKKLPETHIIADFGCGDAKLAQSVSHKVYSIDLVSARDDVIACDMANTPLKSGTIDVAVYCLSLMGTNLQDFLLEANRVLRLGGLVIIAEISSRFDSINEFIRNVTNCGFQLERRELSHKMFAFFKFKKTENVPKNNVKVKGFSLKPCLYKKR